MNPKVSVCLPNFNHRKFLPERLDSILAQTFPDWELVVVDSYSDDGAWELLQEYAKQEPRIRLFQAPREGIYAGFNACIRLAQGEYIYIATSDDTMAPDCLAKMVKALDTNPDCELCQCALELIDENSQPLPQSRQWHRFTVSQYLDKWLHCHHKRLAPYDGILHFAVMTVYTSITQLLIRKRLFEAIGYFETCWGVVADFEWEMRASLLYNTVYIPEKLATWRIHPEQATQNPYTFNSLYTLIKMCHHALETARMLNPEKVTGILFSELSLEYERTIIILGLKERKPLLNKLVYLLYCLFKFPRTTINYAFNKIFSFDKNQYNSFAWITTKIEQLNIPLPIEVTSSHFE
jgi:glycosyltransferase involved in cell wall biosynthesis